MSGADADAFKVGPVAVGAHGSDQCTFAQNVHLDTGAAAGAVDRPAADTAGAQHIDHTVNALPGILAARKMQEGM